MNAFHLYCIMFFGGMAMLFLEIPIKIFPMLLIGAIMMCASPVSLIIPIKDRNEQYQEYKWLADARHVHSRQLHKKEYGFKID